MGQSVEVEEKSGQTVGQVSEIEAQAGQAMGQTSEMGQSAGQVLATEEKSLLDILLSNPEIHVREIAPKLDMSKSAVSRLMQKLKDKKIIERVGSSQNGYWKVTIGDKANG